MLPRFVPGLLLGRAFYAEAVRPLLDEAFPGLRYAAARVGPGSDVLGFDTQRSVDHDWGPRLELFLAPEDVRDRGERVSALLSHRLPARFRGWWTHFEPPRGPVRVMAATDGRVAHRVTVTDVATWSQRLLGFDARAQVGVLDWLATPAQRLAEVTGGALFHDGIGDLGALRRRLRWYPDDVWRYVLACQWLRIAEEEPFVGRAAEAGDERGSRVVSARLVREVMRLCLVLARRYPPYSKWLGRAFAAVPGVEQIAAALTNALDATRRMFHDRPYPVIDAGRFANALFERIEDRELAFLPPVGAVDQCADSTAVLSQPAIARALMTALWTARAP